MAQVASPTTNAAMAARLERDVANLHGELNIAKRKLSSKSEALMILSADLDACRTERDQYKLMAEQLQSRHVAIKKQLAGVVDEGRSGGDLDVDQLWRLLAEHQAKSKSVALEAEDLKQRLAEAEGDNRALRERLGRRRMGEDDEAVSRRSWSSSEREALVATLEQERQKTNNLKRDMREVLDQKEELVVERDALKSKHERLNKEMNLMLRGDPERILDLDALTMENAYLKQELARTKEEQSKAAATLTKYRGLLEKRMAKVMGAGKAKTILDDHASAKVTSSSTTPATTSSGLPPSVDALGNRLLKIPPDRASPQAVTHLQKFVVFLQETLQDRSVAIAHQRKTNQILGKKIQILENRLRDQTPHIPGRSPESNSRVSESEESRREFRVHGTPEELLADSLENCRLSPSGEAEFSRVLPDEGHSRSRNLPDVTNDADSTDNHSQFTFRTTRGHADDEVNDEVNDDHSQSRFHITRGHADEEEDEDDTHSVADSFCDFQSAVLDLSSNIKSENENIFASNFDDHNGTPHPSLMDEWQRNHELTEMNHVLAPNSAPTEMNHVLAPKSPARRSPQRENALFKEPRNLEDLLSWDFDNQLDSNDDDNPLRRSVDLSSHSLLTPTVLQ